MKRTYEQPAMQATEMYMTSHILVGSHIGEGNEGQEGDVKGFGALDAPEKGSLFEENPFE